MKLLVCDVEGTIFKAKYRIEGTEYASTMWQPLAKSLGEAAVEEERQSHIKWELGGYSNYLEWVEDTIKIHKKYSLKKDVFDNLISEAEYNDGVVEFFNRLDRNEYIPILISGGFCELIERAQQELSINYGHGACRYFFNKEDGFLESYSYTNSDFEGKYHYLKDKFSIYCLNAKTDWVFVGDGKNDIDIANKSPLAIGINPHPELEKIIHKQINNFLDLLPILEEFEENEKENNKDTCESILNFNKKYHKKGKNDNYVSELEKQNKFLKQENNDLKNRKSKKNINAVSIYDDDYIRPPLKALSDILNYKKVLFIGSKVGTQIYQYFNSYNKNLIVIDADAYNKDYNTYAGVDFIFLFTSQLGHSQGWKVKNELNSVFYAELHLGKRNVNGVENAMTNVLCRHFRIM